MSGDDNDGSVGYGRPPKRSQFSKGKLGNPKGRPKGSRNFSTLLHDELNVKIPITENGNRRKITKREAMIKQLVNKVANGDLRAIPLVMNEIKLQEGATSDRPGTVREADEMVMLSIVKRMRESGTSPTDSEPAPDDQ